MIAFILAIALLALYVFYAQLEVNLKSTPRGSFNSSGTIAPLPSKWKKLFSLVSLGQQEVPMPKKQLDKAEKTVTLMLKPSKEKYFNGKALKKSFFQLGLVAGEDGFLYKAKGIRPLYTVCHLYQPGTFALHQLETSSYSGCLFILCLDESENPLSDFDLMLEDFQKMSQILKAQSLDENGEPLSLSNINYIRDQIMA